ncbi:hypothetical protein HPP92_022346 [Vanilla planifolia]|uniref:Uncharacterized protein n=1 Tax=Vanilla planifolia TaxID=51239 RepID=A0A835UFB9_VANPL|nr:hypothetical protein HPP92_022346 [Vanilla planifolia]
MSEKNSCVILHRTRMRRLPLQKSPLKRSRGTPILKTSSRSAAVSSPPDLSRRKRVKFAGFTGLREQGGDGAILMKELVFHADQEVPLQAKLALTDHYYSKEMLLMWKKCYIRQFRIQAGMNQKVEQQDQWSLQKSHPQLNYYILQLQQFGKIMKGTVFDVLQESEQTTDAHFPSSSSKSNCTFESFDNQLKNLYPSRHGSDYGWLNLACSKKVLCQEPVFKINEKADAVDHDQEEHALAIESSRGFDCSYYRCHHLDWTDCAVTNYLCLSPNSSIPLFPNGMYEFCIGKESYPTINSKAEVGFQEMQLVPFTNEFTNSFDYIQSSGLNLMPGEEMLTDSLLDLHAISVQEHPPPVFVPKDVDRFPITMCADFYQTTGFYSLKNSSFDLRLPDSAHCSLLRVKCLQNFSDGSDHSPIGVDFTLDMSKQSDGFGCFLTGNTCNIPEEELNSMGRPYKLPEGYSPIGDKSYSGSFQID